MEALSTTKGRKFHPQALTTQEVEALLAACSPTSPTGKRNRALIVTLWRGALRCEEALCLQLHDLDQAGGTIRGAREIDPGSWAVIGNWLAVRATFRFPPSAPVFCTLAGGPMQARYVRWMLPHLGQKAGIGKRVHAEGLRYTRKLELKRM